MIFVQLPVHPTPVLLAVCGDDPANFRSGGESDGAEAQGAKTGRWPETYSGNTVTGVAHRSQGQVYSCF